jgi:hypothetical protein
MMFSQMQLADLNKQKVAHIRALEKEIGKHIMAFEPGPRLASMSEQELKKIQTLEKELGVTLLVYDEPVA